MESLWHIDIFLFIGGCDEHDVEAREFAGAGVTKNELCRLHQGQDERAWMEK